MKVLCIGSAVMDIAATPIEDSVNWKEKQRISDIRHYVHAQEMTAPARC